MTDAVPLRAEIARFARRVRKLAPRTKELYSEHLERFADWCDRRGVLSLDTVSVETVESYLADRKAAGWSDSTRWSALCAIRKIIRWSYGDAHPVLEISMDRKPSPPQRTLTQKKADELLALFDTSTPKGIRDLAIVTLALDTGLRADELVHIQLEYLDMERGILMVPVKGGEWGPAAFFEYTASCLAAWLGARPAVASAGVDTLFVSIGGSTRGQPITKDGLRAIFRKFSINSEIGLISPHDLRRTFATLAVENGAPTRAVQVAGRWQHIKMVEHYTRALEARVLHRYSPVNKLMGVKPKGDA